MKKFIREHGDIIFGTLVIIGLCAPFVFGYLATQHDMFSRETAQTLGITTFVVLFYIGFDIARS